MAKKIKRIELIGFWTIFTGEITALFLFILGLPPFHFGYWAQPEPITIGLHTTAAICGVGLLIMGMEKPRLIASCITHPLVLLPGAIGLLSLASMAIASFPFAVFLGAPDTGQGAVWFFDVAILIAGGIVIRRSKKGARLIAVAAGVSVAGMVVFLFPIFRKIGWFTFIIPDFLAFPVVSASVVILTFWPVQRPRPFWIIIFISLLLMLFSKNQTALYVFAALVFLYGLVSWKWPRLASIRAFSILLIVAMPLAVTAAINLAGNPDKLISIASRKEFHRLAQNALSEQPHRFFTGYGWGHLRELLIQYGSMGDRSMGGPGGKIEWDALKHNWPNSLNILLEALFALGLWGTLLILSWLACVPLFCPKGLRPFAMPFMVAYAGIWAAWFHPPSTVPLLALAFAGNAGRTRPCRVNLAFPAVSLLVLVVIGLQAYGAWLVYRDSATCVAEEELLPPDPDMALPGHCPSPFGQYDRGGYLLSDLLMSATGLAASEIEKVGAVSPLNAYRLKRRLCLVKNRLDHGPASLSLKTAFVLAFGRLAFTLSGSSWETERSVYLPEWGERVSDLLKIAPARSDLAIPYLSWALEQGHDKGSGGIITQILEYNPQDPVGLWFSGMVCILEPKTRQKGLSNLKRALDMGIERFVAIDHKLKDMIRSN